jgi:hypothetical protein
MSLSRHDHVLLYRRVQPAWQRVVVIWTVFFMFSIALGRMISLLVDGAPSRVLDVYLGVELLLGILGLGLLARGRSLPKL